MINYFEILLLVHIAGAIIGFGPTFGYAVSGPLSGKLGGPAASGILQSMVAITKKLTFPVAFITQPLTGVLLIFESGRNQNFFSYEWLWTAIVLYVVLLYLALFVQTPAVERMIALGAAGKAGSEEFAATLRKVRTAGPVMTLSLITIIVLMVVKPGN